MVHIDAIARETPYDCPRHGGDGLGKLMLAQYLMVYAIARVLPSLISFAALAIYTRLLTPEEYGTYAIVIAAAGVAQIILFHWLKESVLRFYSGTWEKDKVLLATTAFTFLLVMVSSAVLVGIFELISPSLVSILLLTSGLTYLWCAAWYDLNIELARAELLPRRYVAINTSRALMSLILGTTLILLGFGAKGLLAGVSIGILVSVITFRSPTWGKVALRDREPHAIRSLMMFGLPLAFSFTLTAVVGSADRLMLGWLIGPGAAGQYAASYDLAAVALGGLMLVVYLAIYPLVVRAFEAGGRQAASGLLAANAVLIVGLGLPGLVGLLLLAPNLVGVVLGPGFREQAVTVVRWSALCTFLGLFRAYYIDLGFRLSGRTTGLLWIMLVAAVVNLSLNWILIPTYSLLGAVWASVCAFAIAFLVGLAGSVRVMSLEWPLTEMLKILVATVVMGASLLPIASSRGLIALLAQIGLGSIVYAVATLILDVHGFRGYVRARILGEKRFSH